MIKEFHGKRYYIELTKSRKTLRKVLQYLSKCEALKDEEFSYHIHDNGNYVILSEAKCTAFRGKKYRDWEKVKLFAYATKKVEPY